MDHLQGWRGRPKPNPNVVEHNKFFATTEIPQDNLVFCDDHHDKRGLYEEFGVTHFIEGRTEVHKALEDMVAHPRPQLGDAEGCAANCHRSLHDLDLAGSVHKCW